MARNLALLIVMSFLSVACDSDSPQGLNNALIEQYVAIHPVDERPFTDFQTLLDDLEKKFSGEWYFVGGDRICDGFLTRSDDEEFCEAEIPEDWQPFTYDGKTYYVQPLSGAVE